MSGGIDQVLEALASSELSEDASEVIFELLRDESGPVVLEGGDRGPIYLSDVTVEGFRGIGPKATLPLVPGTGLTLVVGPNGCGKSSFAEALERAFTGTTKRFAGSTADGQENWRNVHHTGASAVRVGLQRANEPGVSELRVSWGDDDPFPGGQRTALGPGNGEAPAWVDNDWTVQLDLYPPLLPYTELAAVIDGKPSELFDQFDRLLGLGALEDAATRAGKAAKQAKDLLDAEKRSRKAACDACENSPIESIQTLAGRVKTGDGDPAAIEREVTTTFSGAGRDQDLASYMQLRPVDPELLGDRLAERDRYQGVVAALEHDQALRAEQAVTLLQQALSGHTAGEAVPCPVCGVGVLDDEWRERSSVTVAEHAQRFGDLRRARTQLQAAVDALRQVLAPVRGLSVHPDVPSSASLGEARSNAETAITEGEPATTIRALLAELNDLIASCSSEATARHDDQAEAARPAIEAVVAWAEAVRQADGAARERAANDDAKVWLRQQIQLLRDERLQDLAAEAKAVWSDLRTTSSVELGPLQLEGSSTRRRLTLTCTTEGADAMARSVLSQGELHAIALSLFIPRALHADSPFGFLVIDDPVQALDRMKVDGLADVLHRLAESRQVVVFTHDDRLPDAVMRLGHEAMILRVDRGTGSTVSVSVSEDAATRALRDAATLARDEALDHDLASRAVAGCCRAAVEARAVRIFRLKAARAGKSVAEIDDVLASARGSLWNRVSLALDGEIKTTMRSELESRGHRKEARLIGQLNAKGHDQETGRMTDPIRLLEETRVVLDRLLPA